MFMISYEIKYFPSSIIQEHPIQQINIKNNLKWDQKW